MRNQIKMNSAMAMLTQATAINHVFDEGAEELGCGPVNYAIELDGQLYLVCHDDDTERMIVVPVDRWELENLLEAIDDPLSVLSLRELDSKSLEKVAARTIAAFALPATTTH
ncbi:hypothetical protein [Chitinivorax sp. B]|uniref:hypothetical protein n=1 Tax=Chitinivorax sp. B TaxID=2502235 RepID=UPI0010F4734C|nr:hypothetical protein [Chitinivorax sp. B]